MRDPRAILAPPPGDGPVSVPGRAAVPVTLLTGFLGAGKTTLLNRILGGDHGLRVGVLVNDFGAINIDASLVESVEANTISLSNGCVCCEIRDDLVASLEELLVRTEAVDYVLLEASGVADPAGVVMTFVDPRYEKLLRLDSIVCVVDAEGVFSQGDDDRLNQLKLRQIAFADLVVLNKTDVVTPDHVEVVKDWIDLHIKRIRVVEATHGDVPLDVLLSVGRFDPGQVPPTDAGGDVSHGGASVEASFQRWSYQTEVPFSREVLRRMVKRELPASVYRCKGIVFTEDEPEVPLVLQVVGRRTQLLPFRGRAPKPGRSDIVAIGREMDGELLSGLFAGCTTRRP